MNIIWKDTSKELINKWYWIKTFVWYTIRHKLRIMIWINGSMYKWDKEYFFYWNPRSSKNIRKICKILTPLLNKIL